MRILIVHQNFPGQFKHLAPALVARGDTVVAMGTREFTPPAGLAYARWTPACATGKDGHPWSRDFDTKVIRGQAALRAAQALRDRGFVPDVILAHPGWGEAMFLKIVWPQARLGLYCEYHYQSQGADVGFDPEFPVPASEDNAARMRVRNIALDMAMADAVAGIAPTRWQADTFPDPFRQRITIVHDGIDTRTIGPNPDALLDAGDRRWSRQDEVITFVARNLEPYRGYHVFMRALPRLLALRPQAQVLIIGGDGVSYGAPPPEGRRWKDIFLDEVRDAIDLSRVHFLGNLPYDRFLAMLQVSRVHVYLTYPFVLSWSLMEAMATGCAIVASDTAPVREMMADGQEGLLVPFHAPDTLASTVADLAADAGARARLGEAARRRIVENHDLMRHCLPAQLEFIDAVAGFHD